MLCSSSSVDSNKKRREDTCLFIPLRSPRQVQKLRQGARRIENEVGFTEMIEGIEGILAKMSR